MTPQITSYLTFNGNCREAMLFYKSCLGGELTFQTVDNLPFLEKIPKQMKDCIIHATLVKDSLVLMGTDMVSPKGIIKGNTISLHLQCDSLEQIRTCYKKLSKDGNIEHPLEHNFWGVLFGDFTDKYGNHWLLSYENNNS